MTMNKKLLTSILLAGALSLTFAASCAQNDGDLSSYTSQERYYDKLGTAARLVVSADFNDSENVQKLTELGNAVEDFLNDLENSLSTSVSTSSISRFNQAEAGAEVQIDYMAYTVLKDAIYMYEYTQGYYNPAVYYSVDLFGFTPRFANYTFEADISTRTPYDRVGEDEDGMYVTARSEPDEHYVEIFKELASHMDELEVYEKDGAYYARKPDYTVEGLYGDTYSMALDLGGIGKGYAADVVNDLMTQYGFEYGYFNFGSSSYYVKQSAGTADNTWAMSLTNPDNIFATYARFNVKSAGLSTSGDYEKAYTLNGTTYCHIIDPFTGRPKTIGIAACTLVGGTAARDDALTTALLVMGEEKAVEFINANLKDYQIAMIVRGTSGPCEHIVTNVANLEYNTAYALGNTIDGDGNIILN